jgi:hypothetical protein
MCVEGEHFYTPAPPEGGVYCFTSVRPSFRRIFLSNYWWQKSDIWSQASYRYAILWEASDSYFLFADLVGFYTHWFFSAALTILNLCYSFCVIDNTLYQ